MLSLPGGLTISRLAGPSKKPIGKLLQVQTFNKDEEQREHFTLVLASLARAAFPFRFAVHFTHKTNPSSAKRSPWVFWCWYFDYSWNKPTKRVEIQTLPSALMLQDCGMTAWTESKVALELRALLAFLKVSWRPTYSGRGLVHVEHV